MPAFGQAVRLIEGARFHLSAGGNVAWVALAVPGQVNEFDTRLRELRLSGMAFRGEAPLWLGLRARPQITGAVKIALDPSNRFPTLDD